MNDDIGVVHHNCVPPWQLNAFVPVVALNCVLELCLRNTTKTHTDSQKEETTSSHTLRQIQQCAGISVNSLCLPPVNTVPHGGQI